MTSTSYFFDYMDFFKAEYHFSNRTSSAAGKLMTFGYMVVFFTLAIQAIITVLNYTDKFFTITTTYDNTLVQNGPTTLNHLHMISYVQIISKSGLPMSHDFRKSLFNEYFSAQVSSLKSSQYNYSKKNLMDYLCDDKSQTLIFCIDFEISSIDDLIFISINKAQSKNPDQFKQFFDKYSLRIQIDHYYLRSCDKKFFFDLNEWTVHMKDLFPKMVQYRLFDYISNSKGFYTDSITSINYNSGLSNVEINYKLNDFLHDTNLIVSNPESIKMLSVLSQKVINSPNLFSFNLRMSNYKDSYGFVYLKLPQAFANVMGIMEACKFAFIVFNLLINFLLQNLTMFDHFYSRKVRFLKPELEDATQLITIVPFSMKKDGIIGIETDKKIELSEKVLETDKNAPNIIKKSSISLTKSINYI